MPVNANESAALLDLAKSFTSSFEQRDRLSAALREHLGVTPRDSFYVSDDGTDDVLGPVVIYRLDRDCCDTDCRGAVKSLPSGGDEPYFRVTYARLGDGYTFGEPVKVRRVTAYEAVRDSDAGEGLDAGQDEAEVPEWLAGALARAASLTKGAGHRYIRRVPKSGGGYRYFYKVSGGGGLGHEDEMKVGAKFRVANGGKEGHFEIVGKDDKGNLRIKHDESGHESSVSPAALRSMLHAEHAQSLTAHREKLAADIKATDDPKAKARLLAEAGKYEHTKDLAEAGKITNDLSSLKAGDLVRPHTPSGEPYGDTWAVQGRLADGRITIRNPEKGLAMVIDPAKPTDIRKIEGLAKPEPDKDSLRNELSTLRSKVAVPDKVFMPAGWNPTAHRAKFAKEHERIDQIEEALGQKYWQRDPARVRSVEGMPERKHREIVKTAALAGKPVPADVIAAHPGLADEIASAKSPAAAPGDHTKLYNWGSTYEHPTARATMTAARTMTVGDRDYQLVPQPRPGKAPGFVANASMPGRAGSLDAKGNMTAEAPHVFDTAAEAHAAVVKHEAAQGAAAKPQGGGPKSITLNRYGAKIDHEVKHSAGQYHVIEQPPEASTKGRLKHFPGHYSVVEAGPDGQADVSRRTSHLTADEARSLANDLNISHPGGFDSSGGDVGKMNNYVARQQKAATASAGKLPKPVIKESAAKSETRKSMSTVTDPERDLAKSLAASHRAAAEAQPDAGAKDAHEAAAQACDTAATADSTSDFRKALGAAERIGGLIKAWSGIPADQRRDFGAFAKSMQSPGGRLGDICFAASNGTGDALGQMGRAFENARPPAEQLIQVAPDPTTYSPQRGAVNGMRKSMGSFYDRLSAGAAQQAVQGIRCPPEAKLVDGGR